MRDLALGIAALLLAACTNESAPGATGSTGRPPAAEAGPPATGEAGAGAAGGATHGGSGGNAAADGAAGNATAGTGGEATAGTGGEATGTGGGGAAGTESAASAGTGGGGADGGARGGAGGESDLPCRVAWAGDVQAGTAADDQILGMTVDADDNIIVSGYERGTVGVTNIEPDGNSRAVVVKYGPAGTLSWKAVLDTSATDTAEDVAIDPATGTLVVLGRTSGAFPPFANQGQFDLILAALEPDGRISTVFQNGNERPQHPARVSVAPGGAIAVAGWDDTYVPSNYVAGQQDGFVAIFTVDPAPAHTLKQASLQYTLPPSRTGPFSYATGVAADPDGSGAVYVTGKVSTNNIGLQGIFVTKLLADQSVVWNEIISPLGSDAVNAVALSPSGDLFVTGATSLTIGPSSSGEQDAFLLKIDKTNGSLVWAAMGGGPQTDYPTALAFDGTGNIYVAGVTFGSVIDGVANQGSGDLFAMKFSPSGEQLGAWQRGTSTYEQITSMAVDRCGRVFVGGFTGGTLVPGQPSAGAQDMFILKADLP